MAITVKDVNNAIDSFNAGLRPYRFTKSRTWYIRGNDTNLYPLKYIYSLIIEKEPAKFNTSEPISQLKDLNIEIIHIPNDNRSEFYKSVVQSLKDGKARKSRLKKASKTPKLKTVTSVEYIRNPDVVAEVLSRANGFCECCKKKAPFKRKDGSDYLEVHHKIFLSNYGEDSVDNAEALCPNCHREKHYG